MNILEKYTVIRSLGSGSFGSVQLAKHKLTGSFVAIKRGENLAHECTVLQWLKWIDYVPKLKWYSPSIAIMEYVGNPITLNANDAIEFSQMKSTDWLKQLVAVLKDIHEYGILHRDIKPDNIILHPQSGRIYLIDFGLSGLIANQMPINGIIGSPNYCSRSVHLRERLGKRDDIESAFYSCFYWELPYADEQNHSENELMHIKTALLNKYVNSDDSFIKQTIIDIITLTSDENPSYLGSD